MPTTTNANDFSQQFHASFGKDMLQTFYSANSTTSTNTPANVAPPNENNINNNGSSQTIQLVSLSDMHMLNNWRNMGLVPLQSISVPQFNNTENTNTNSNPNPNPSSNTVLSDSSSNENSATSTFKLIESGSLLPQNSSTATNIFSLDSHTGTLKPLMIAPRPNDSVTNDVVDSKLDSAAKSEDNSKTGVKQQPKSVNNKPAVSLEEMSLNELRDECVRRNLPKSGRPKQKLIERIKDHMLKCNGQQQQQQFVGHVSDAQQQLFNRQHSATKSPDSGVNMDGSPSFMSCMNKHLNI